jgi:hypothetical protein
VKSPNSTSHPPSSAALYTAAEDMDIILSFPQTDQWVNIHLAVNMKTAF